MTLHPLFLLIQLAALVGVLWKLGGSKGFGRWFRLFPIPLWCYLVPMGASALGWLPAQHPLYSLLSRELLPICLVLLLIGTDLKGLARLGPKATLLMLAGSLGTVVGGLVSFGVYQSWLPEGAWAGIGALSASWIGGSANLLAVKESLGLSDALVGPIVLVDALVAYGWMGLLLWASGFQARWDRRVGVNDGSEFLHRNSGPAFHGPGGSLRFGRPIHPGTEKKQGASPRGPLPAALPTGLPRSRGTLRQFQRILGITAGIVLGIVVSRVAQGMASRLPVWADTINPFTWAILLATGLAMALALTPLAKLERVGLSRVGTFALYLLLASIGARGNLKAATEAPIFLALGLTGILIHGAALLLTGCLAKAPLGLIATASQANIGGPISAPIVGATYHPSLATVGLLMAILGNLLGTPLGLLTAALASLLGTVLAPG